MELEYFTAAWCAGCKQVKPYLDQVTKAVVRTWDVETPEGWEASLRYDVQSLPTVVAVEDGRVVWVFSGVMKELLERLSELR